MKQNCIAILLLGSLFSICANAQDQPKPQPQIQPLQIVPQAPVTPSSEASYVGPPPQLNKTPQQNAPRPKQNQPMFIDAGGNLKMINGSNANNAQSRMPPPSTPIIVPEQSLEVDLPIQPEPGLPTPTQVPTPSPTPTSTPTPTSAPIPQPASVEPQPTPTPMPKPMPATLNATETPTQIIPEGPGVPQPTPPPLPETVLPQSLPTPPTNPMPSGSSY